MTTTALRGVPLSKVLLINTCISKYYRRTRELNTVSQSTVKAAVLIIAGFHTQRQEIFPVCLSVLASRFMKKSHDCNLGVDIRNTTRQHVQ
ncbi:hypothetical protein BaRGS_00023077 [Batillaria attramentaria]|uniref:Uncharacterized protein n=1 Tax=Batillaria attramentaria TaxID=370345 RepID=A0ABD0KF62_9CAEN